MKVTYDDIIKIDNIIESYNVIRKNTKNKDKLVKFDLYISNNIVGIYNELSNKKYKHDKYNIFLIKEPKLRIVMSESLKDKIINHLLCEYYLKELIEKRLINSNVATRKDKGTKEGIRLLKKYINDIKLKYNNFYILKIDIKKYFFNIDHNILINKLEKIIDDKNILNIIKEIINSTNEEYINYNIKKLVDNDDYLYKYNKGLNIGSQISQILASYYLNDIDHYIKEVLRIKYYIRYVDDFILIDRDYKYLEYCLEKIKIELEKIGLMINNKTRIYDIKKGFNFLGYKFFIKDNKLIMKVINKNYVRIRKKLKVLYKIDRNKYNKSLISYKGYINNNKTYKHLQSSTK